MPHDRHSCPCQSGHAPSQRARSPPQQGNRAAKPDWSNSNPPGRRSTSIGSKYQQSINTKMHFLGAYQLSSPFKYPPDRAFSFGASQPSLQYANMPGSTESFVPAFLLCASVGFWQRLDRLPHKRRPFRATQHGFSQLKCAFQDQLLSTVLAAPTTLRKEATKASSGS